MYWKEYGLLSSPCFALSDLAVCLQTSHNPSVDSEVASDRFVGVVLAAGRGSRMASDTPKVLLPVAGRPLVEWVLDCLSGAGVRDICVVVPQDSVEIRAVLGSRVEYAVQAEPTGTADAARCALRVLDPQTEHIVLACGDSPLFLPATVAALEEEHLRAGAAVTLTSAILDNPTGYGRIVRSNDGVIVRVCEEKQAGQSERKLKEVNGGLYAFEVAWLRAQLEERLGPERIQGASSCSDVQSVSEFVLTRVVEMAVPGQRAVASVSCDPEEIGGVNTPEELARAERTLAVRQSADQAAQKGRG